jgi:hypothetical protein
MASDEIDAVQSGWHPADINPSCVDPGAFVELGITWHVPVSPFTKQKLHQRACILATLGLSTPQIVSFITQRDPERFSVSTAAFIAKLSYFHDYLGLNRATIARLISAHSRLCDYSLENKIKRRVALFEEYFEVDGPTLGIIVARHPRILWVSPTLLP